MPNIVEKMTFNYSPNFDLKKRKKSKNKARTKGYRKEQLQEKDDINDLKDWQARLLRDSD